MASAAELQEPDESRPSKRVRLDAPLAATEEFVEEMADVDDWDDIYDTEDAQQAETTAATRVDTTATLGGIPSDEALEERNGDVAMQGAETSAPNATTDGGIPPEAIAGDDELVAPRPAHNSSDEATKVVLEESTNVVDEAKNESAPAGAAVQDSKETLQTAGPMNPELIAKAEQPKATNDPEFMAAAQAQKNVANAEWQFDSSDAESSSDSDSTDSDDESDSGSEGGYEMLDPITAAKMLMSGDDEDGDEKGKKGGGDHQPRTLNEVKETVIPKPDIVVTSDMKITLLGQVEQAVESMILIRGATPGEYQVLESGSVLCNEGRTVIGAIAETFGRVQEPMYSVAFTNEQEIQDVGMTIGTKVFYVDAHSTFVFTQPLRNLKGTDASNIHDEEIGEDEMEFSDDEAEAEYKRQRKANKKAGRGDLSRGAFNERQQAAANQEDMDTYSYTKYNDAPSQDYGNGLSYDDGDQTGEDFYQPLKRPENLSSLMSGGQSARPQQQSSDRGRGRGRGDFRGRGRGERGRGRGGFDRGGHNNGHRGGREGNFSQNSAPQTHRGSEHSFPDRHNSTPNAHSSSDDRPQHALPPRPQASALPPQPPAHQPYPQQSPPQEYQYPQSHQYQQPPRQQYQFNGYTFQYGQPAAAPQPQHAYGVPPQPMYNAPPPQQPQPYASIPPGSHINPAFYPQYAQAQAQVPQQAWPGHASAQQYQATTTAYPQQLSHVGGAPEQNVGQAMQDVDIGDILKRLSNAPRK